MKITGRVEQVEVEVSPIAALDRIERVVNERLDSLWPPAAPLAELDRDERSRRFQEAFQLIRNALYP